MISCPSCGSEQIHQSRRKGFLEKRILLIVFVRPFRCEECDDRFFRWSLSATPNGEQGARKTVVFEAGPKNRMGHAG